MYWDSYDCEIQCEDFYDEDDIYICPEDFYEDVVMDDYDWELWSRRQKKYALVV